MSDAFKNLRIVIVDDFEMIRLTIRTALQKLEVTNIEEATDGADGLHRLRARVSQGNPVDLVFCDWNMPNMTGIQLLAECKKDPSLAGIPFVMVTSETDKGNVLDALRLGAADYIVKPFAVESIEKKIRKILKLTG